MNWNGLELPDAYYKDDAVIIYHADCRLVLPLIPDKSIDLVLTDPPYKSQHLEYGEIDISFLSLLGCRQLIFWSARDKFPMSFTAQHIWDKQVGINETQYEIIYERNGGNIWKVYNCYRFTNKLNARWLDDVFVGHPSQKPQKLISKLITEYSEMKNIILDPFLGSGTTLVCAKKLGRKAIGIEIEERYCKIAVDRLRQSVMRLEP